MCISNIRDSIGIKERKHTPAGQEVTSQCVHVNKLILTLVPDGLLIVIDGSLTCQPDYTHNNHKHNGAQVDDEEEEGDHGQSEDPTYPPILPSVHKHTHFRQHR